MIVFFKSVQRSNPHFNAGKYPNSLLIILCQGRRPESNRGASGLSEPRIRDERRRQLPTQPRASGARQRRARQQGRARRGVRRYGCGRAVLAPPRSAAARSPPPTSGSISWPPGSAMSARAPASRRSSSSASMPPASRRCSGRSAARRSGPLDVVQFLGSKHANFNIGLWRRDSLAGDRRRAISATFSISIAADGRQVDLVALFSQPLSWDGIANPFALLAAPAVGRHERAAQHRRAGTTR